MPILGRNDAGYSVFNDPNNLDLTSNNAADFFNTNGPSTVLSPTPVNNNNNINDNTMLTDLYNSLLNQTGPTSTQQSTTNTQQNQSPELEAMAQQFNDQLNQLSGGFTDAYQGKQDSFDDLIRALSNTYRTRESGVATGAASGALSSGLTPLEAAGASQDASLQTLQQYFPQLAEFQNAQADVGVDLQNSLAGLQQNLNLPFMNNILSPYYQGVAGTTTTQNSQTTDNLSKQNLLAQLAEGLFNQQVTNQELDYRGMELDQNQRQFDASQQQQMELALQQLGLSRDKLSQQSSQFGQNLANTQDQFQSNLDDRLASRDFKTSEREAGQQFNTENREDVQLFQQAQQRNNAQRLMQDALMRGNYDEYLSVQRGETAWDSIQNYIYGDTGLF